MSEQELKEQLGDELCEFCPWRKGEIDHTFDSLCEGSYCDDAFDNFLDETKVISMMKNNHCSECKYYWCYPHTTQMYCYKLGKRITARKKSCKHYQPNS